MKPLAARSDLTRCAAIVGSLLSVVLAGVTAEARPNTHAPAISTWDPRASSVVFGLGRAVSGAGDFTLASYNANFSSTSGVLSAQFGAHYVTFRDPTERASARGFSAGGVALISLPLSERSEEGIPGASFAFYIGGVPTALFSGQLNFVSVPLVLGVGVPWSPASAVTITPWAELSPGVNFDTRIQAISTSDAIAAAMDGTLTRQEVEDLVEEGLDISRDTSLGTRAGLNVALHLGSDVDINANLMLGAGQGSAVGLGAGLVFRWDDVVPGVRAELESENGVDGRRSLQREPTAGSDCASIEAQFRSCPAAGKWQARDSKDNTPTASPPPASSQKPATERPPPVPPLQVSAPPPTPTPTPGSGAAARGATSDSRSDAPAPVGSEKKKPAPSAADEPALQPSKPSRVPELPPLQAAPPRPQ